MSPKKNPTARGSMWVDLRMPFAATVLEGLLLLGVIALLAYLNVPHTGLVALGVLVFYLVTAGAVLLAFTLRYAAMKRAEKTAEQLSGDVYRTFRSEADIPYAVVNSDGMVRVVNTALQDILGYRTPVCNLPLREICPRVSFERLTAAARTPERSGEAEIPSVASPENSAEANGTDVVVRLPNGRRYRADSYLMRRDGEHYYLLLFRDVNDYLELLEKTDRERVVIAYVMLDNLQELTQFVRANYRATANLIEETLTTWVEGMNGVLREYDRDKYLALFHSRRHHEHPRRRQLLPAFGIHGHCRRGRKHAGQGKGRLRRLGHGTPARR